MTLWVLIHRVSAAIIVVVGLVWTASLFYPKFKQASDLAARQRAIEEEIRHDEEVLAHLRDKQQRLLNDSRFVEKIAREELGLAKPGETIFKFEDARTSARR
jgi:cell division protein FtsB